jgi:hypothetical protein
MIIIIIIIIIIGPIVAPRGKAIRINCGASNPDSATPQTRSRGLVHADVRRMTDGAARHRLARELHAEPKCRDTFRRMRARTRDVP